LLQLIPRPPVTGMQPVTDILHGVPVVDPYRWLEEQSSPRTRQWIDEQTKYARLYLDRIPKRAQIRARVHQFLAVETYDSLQKANGRYFFRKRLPDQEQPCIYMREGPCGKDQLLLDPSEIGCGTHIAVKPLKISPDGKLLLYEIKEGGERTGRFAILDIASRLTLPDILPRGYLRGFAFAVDGKSVVYVHEPAFSKAPYHRAAFRHVLGTNVAEDREVFCVDGRCPIQLALIADARRVAFLVYRFEDKPRTDFYLKDFDDAGVPECVLADAEYDFIPTLARGRIFALTNQDAANRRIVELRPARPGQPEWVEVVPESDSCIHRWLISGDRILVSYILGTQFRLLVFDFKGQLAGQFSVRPDETVRVISAAPESDEIFLETESFTRPLVTTRYCAMTGSQSCWSRRKIPFKSKRFRSMSVTYKSKDGTCIPMFLVGRPSVLARGCHATILTSYGGYGVPMTPQFSVFVAFLLERGCIFALPQIRGGWEFGSAWHEAARRRNRQKAYDDFLAAAEWLIQTGRTKSDRLAIFGGSNAGLLVGVAMTQRPELFRAVVCMAPMLDMLRYHLFDNAQLWRGEFGTADDQQDFTILRQYSPYHNLRDAQSYPAAMFVSGDADQNCNPMHARKMTARLQAAAKADRPVILDYSKFRGHSPVLPLSDRVEALTDRLAFLCDQLGLLT